MVNGFKTRRGDPSLQSSQTSPLMLFPRQDASSSCITTCPEPNPCPACPEGQICVGVIRSCEACGSNVCKPDPDYKPASTHKSSPLGGALGGVLAVLAVIVIGYFLWMRRKKRKLELQRKIRNETKVKEAGVAFRPKRKSSAGGEKDTEQQSGGVAIEMNDQSRKSKSSNGSSHNGGPLDEAEEVVEDEEDIEWTEMRSDGLTVYKKPNGMSDKEAEEEYLRNLEMKRYSSGAATHLSRITEGIEEEDEVASLRRASSLHPSNPPPLPPLHNLTNNKSHSHSSSINLDPGNGGGSARSRKSKSDFNGFNANPFSDSASETSSNNHSNRTINGNTSPIAAPDPVHRATGAPLVDLQSGKAPSRRGSLAPSTSSTTSSSNNHGNGSSNSGHSSNSHQAGMSRNLLSPNVNSKNAAPMRPSRAPDLNLRLADGAEPGAKSQSNKDSRFKIGLGIDPRESFTDGSRRESAATFDSYNTDASGRPMSPAAASSNFHHSSGGHSTLKSPISPNNLISPGAQSQRFDFMSIDPSSSSANGNYSSALEASNVYSRNDGKRLSSATVGTLGTMNTTASDYVLSKPQIMTLSSPATLNPIRSNPNTPGLKASNASSPVIVRPSNANSKPQVLKNLAQAKERGLLRTSPRGTPISEVSNPFSDDNSHVEAEDGLESSASSLAPRIRNPFSDDHSSELDQDFHSISDQSQVVSRALSPSGTFGNGRSKSRGTNRGASRGSTGGAQTPNTFGGIDEGEDLEEEDDDFVSELNARRNRNTSRSFSSNNQNNRDSTATFQTVASGFSMGIPFIDVNKSKTVPLRDPESSSPRDEKGSYDTAEVGERSSWLSQSPSISPNPNRNVGGQSKAKGEPSTNLNPNDNSLRRRDDERASVISTSTFNSTVKEDEDVIINQAEKVDLKRGDSAKRYEYEVGRNGNVTLSRSNSSNTNGVGPYPPNSSASSSRINSMVVNNNSRQSNASSIGGLSAFDFAPFNGEDNETMPIDAVQKAKSHQSANQSQLLSRSGSLDTPSEGPSGIEDEELLQESSTGQSVGRSQGQTSHHARNNSSLSGKVINTGADPEAVEQIRLAHELSNYPFQMG